NHCGEAHGEMPRGQVGEDTRSLGDLRCTPKREPHVEQSPRGEKYRQELRRRPFHEDLSPFRVVRCTTSSMKLLFPSVYASRSRRYSEASYTLSFASSAAVVG